MFAESEIPVPDVVTETVNSIDGTDYAIVETVPGTTAEKDISPKRTRNAARCIAAIHDFTSFDRTGWIHFEDGEPTVRQFGEGSLKRRIRRVLEERSTDLRDGGLETAGRTLEDVPDLLATELPDVPEPVLCHDDFSPDNVCFEGEAVTGILDFDRVYAGHAHRDLVQAANAFWMHDPCAAWDVRAEFYEGYREGKDLNDAFEDNESLYRVETLANIVAGLLELDELSEYEREFYEERLLEAIDRIDTG